ncbi:hypothetical protein [Meiothermus ruber]|uniref:Uncharacterized protein n=2 Tax=Meiothermus ruber (strain ATCC 35948 / DSM 1279 / VKM B-1258 / 21) TaxID=504728 RepID=A0A806CR43_MEIRD|nr:hypothetical protein [Meiothermus ruber]ADD29663.1 hypothetical protein Mrub_2916 [Meiothermus ruber DSM 1279]MCL6530585.1 hypothetical protein [Meiothermus ruber]
MILATPKCSLDYGGAFSHVCFVFWSLVVGLVLLLVACGSQQASCVQDTLTYEAVPAYIGQALAVNASKDDLNLTPQTVQNKWIVSTLIHDPLMRPAFWANLIVDGERPSSFWQSVSNAKNDSLVYLTGAATNRTFHSSLFPVEVFKSVHQTCGECRLVKYGNGLYAVRGQEWLDAKGNRLSASETDAIKKNFAAIASSVEQGDIPKRNGETLEATIGRVTQRRALAYDLECDQ